MRIALLSIAKPETGTGNGTTEYAFQLYQRLKKAGNRVDLVYALRRSQRDDPVGLLYTNTLFKNKIRKLAKQDYDVIHILIQEMGFAARILKEEGSSARVITTVHDIARLRKRLYGSSLQKIYNRMVERSINDAIEYSDFILFNSSQTEKEVKARFRVRRSRLVWHGTRSSFLKEPISRRVRKRGELVVGYVGSLGQHKNVISILKVANILRKESFRFLIYGTGTEYSRILEYKKRMRLDNVELRGFAPESRLVRIYDNFDVFMLPSSYEGLSHQSLEAQARGIPTITYGWAEIPEEVTRFCLKAENETDAARILRGLSRRGFDAKRRNKMIRYARGFSWDKTAEGTLKVYREILKNNSA